VRGVVEVVLTWDRRGIRWELWLGVGCRDAVGNAWRQSRVQLRQVRGILVQ